MGVEQFQAGSMSGVVAVEDCVERAGIDDQCDWPNPVSARISSIRSEVSV